MHIFVSTQATQGHRSNDFSFPAEGEILTFGVFECTGEEPDGACGCARSLCGVQTLKGTTTMRVQTFNGDMPALIGIIRDALDRGGWTEKNGETWAEATARQHARAIVQNADRFPAGAVVERRGRTQFQVREVRPTTGINSWCSGDALEDIRDRFFKMTNLDLEHLDNEEIRALMELLPAALLYCHARMDMRIVYTEE